MPALEFLANGIEFATAAATGEPAARATRGSRARIALISAVDELCGIGAYCRSLERQLNDFFDVQVFGLDQYLLRGRHRRMRQLGDRHIKEICRELREFDAVNLQLEYGTLGRAVRDIYRRLAWILAPQGAGRARRGCALWRRFAGSSENINQISHVPSGHGKHTVTSTACWSIAAAQ
jgi:hypothetical protein